MSPPTDGGATTTAEEFDQAPAETSEGWNGDRERRGLPPLPRFTRPARPRAETPPAGMDPDPGAAAGHPGAPGPAATPGPGSDTPPTLDGKSSRGSTDRPRPGDDREEWVDPKDLQAAVRQATDVAFVLVGQGFGTVERRARGLETVSEKWVPTREERELVLGPAGRIAKRHIRADRVALDTIDGCMMAAGVGAFAMRGFFGVEPMPDRSEPPPPHARTATGGPAGA